MNPAYLTCNWGVMSPLESPSPRTAIVIIINHCDGSCLGPLAFQEESNFKGVITPQLPVSYLHIIRKKTIHFFLSKISNFNRKLLLIFR